MARFKENANMFSIADPMKAPMMHGHTCIELRDVKTGKRERVESDNTFMASTLSEFMGYMGYANNAPLINGDFAGGNILTELCGGVLLFRDTIPANSKYMNAGNEMTANGSYNVSNNTTPVELGTWNTIESNVEGNSSAVLVWDWDTAHGNGQISSVCLTSANGGYIGYGNKSGIYATRRSVYNLMPGRSSFTSFKKYYNNMGIQFAYTKPNLTITKYRYPMTKASVFDKRIKSTTQIDLTDYDMAYNSIMITNIEHDKAMIYTNNIVNDNTEFKWLLYNYADGTIQTKTLMNATGRAIYPNRAMFLEDENVYVIDMHNSPWKILVVNPTTGAIIKSIDTEGDMGANIHRFAPNLLYYSGWNRIIDLVNESQYLTNGGVIAAFENAQTIYDTTLDCFVTQTTNNSRSSLNVTPANILKNQMYLATINNLDNAVTKSNTQTMKVTYTLTEV